MNARSWNGCGLAITLIALLSQTAFAYDGRPSRDTLADMGLSGLIVVADEDALSIRGQGFMGGSSVRVFGNSFATINTKNGGAHSENGYVANGKHFAAGGNFSFAGVTVKKSNGKDRHGKPGHGGMGGGWGKPGGNMGGWNQMGHTTIKSIIVFAGGHSWATAF